MIHYYGVLIGWLHVILCALIIPIFYCWRFFGCRVAVDVHIYECVRTYAYIQFYHHQQYAASMLWTFFTLRKTDLAARACWIDMNMHIILNTISLLAKGHHGISVFFLWVEISIKTELIMMVGINVFSKFCTLSHLGIYHL